MAEFSYFQLLTWFRKRKKTQEWITITVHPLKISNAINPAGSIKKPFQISFKTLKLKYAYMNVKEQQRYLRKVLLFCYSVFLPYEMHYFIPMNF